MSKLDTIAAYYTEIHKDYPYANQCTCLQCILQPKSAVSMLRHRI